MHYSGILVIVNPGDVLRVIPELDALAGTEVHHHHVESGRIVVVQETETVSEQQEGLRRIQALPSVQMAALVEHRIDSEPADQPATGPLGEQR
jgi:nitrate reductase NapAB chaperone NapD